MQMRMQMMWPGDVFMKTKSASHHITSIRILTFVFLPRLEARECCGTVHARPYITNNHNTACQWPIVCAKCQHPFPHTAYCNDFLRQQLDRRPVRCRCRQHEHVRARRGAILCLHSHLDANAP